MISALTQEYELTKRLLRWMLRRNPEERATLSEILQDSELRKALENPLDGRVVAPVVLVGDQNGA